MPTFGRLAGVAPAVVAFLAAGCREIPAPEGGVQSISALVFPSPGVVAGDTLRDSLGLAAPLSLIAYGLDNQPVDPQPEPTFVVLDTGAFLVDGRYLVGRSAGTSVRIVGAVAALQTQPATIRVTLSPDSLVAADSTLHRMSYQLPDTAAQTQLTLVVQHYRSTDTVGVEAVVVRYSVDRAPQGSSTAPTVVLLNGNAISHRDTTDATGRVSRLARLRLTQMTSFVQDTVMVSAAASYRGVSIGAVQFTIVFTNTAQASGSARDDHQ